MERNKRRICFGKCEFWRFCRTRRKKFRVMVRDCKRFKKGVVVYKAHLNREKSEVVLEDIVRKREPERDLIDYEAFCSDDKSLKESLDDERMFDVLELKEKS